MAGEVRAAIQRLPAAQRQVVELAYFRVLDASRRARAAGEPVPEVPAISPAEAFSLAADALYRTLTALNTADWSLPAIRDLDAQGLVGHLTGVEEDVQRCLAGDQAVSLAGHGMRLPLGALLVVRAFELWIHENDIRLAAGLPLAVPDAPVLRVMTRLAARLLPGAAARAGVPGPGRLHLVLTGPGGGTWDPAARLPTLVSCPLKKPRRSPACASWRSPRSWRRRSAA
jgi:hypothetical protein